MTEIADGRARAVVEELKHAHDVEVAARAARSDYIEAEYRAGRRPKDIARTLTAWADQLDLDPLIRKRFGVSESSVHHTLDIRGAKHRH